MSTATQARASAVTRACRDAIPVVLAYAPFGLALGATLAATRILPIDHVAMDHVAGMAFIRTQTSDGERG